MLILAAPVILGLAAACSPSSEPVDAEAAAGPQLEAVDPTIEAELIIWRDLMPDAELEALRALNEGEADPSLMGQFVGNSPIENQSGTFNVVEDLDGVVARMPGYILPLDFAEHGEAREFLLLPFHGACVHYPPPPPNQIVYLRSPEPVRFNSLWEPVWVEGRLSVERVDTDLAASAYSMVLRSVSPYDVQSGS
jgi:hypothetical protein